MQGELVDMTHESQKITCRYRTSGGSASYVWKPFPYIIKECKYAGSNVRDCIVERADLPKIPDFKPPF